MKKLLFFSAILLVAFHQDADAGSKIRIIRENGTEVGFNDIREYHNGDTHKLTCKNSGYAKAEFTVSPNSEAVRVLVPLIEKALAEGITSGKIEKDGMSATWKGTDKYNVVMNLRDK